MARGLLLVAGAIAAVIVAVLFSGGATPPPRQAVAALQDDHLPTAALDGIGARLDLLKATGITTTRVDLFWSDIAPSQPAHPDDPADPAYDFTRADRIMSGLAARGITPIVCVYSAPAWASGDSIDALPGSPVNRLAPDPEAFGTFMGALAARYRGDYGLPDGSRLPPVRYFEIWNEPNLSGFFIPPSPGAAARLDVYAAMESAAYGAIKRANPDTVVIAGVGGPASSSGPKAMSAVEWLRGLRRRDIPLDAYSQHVYPAAAPLLETGVVPSWSSLGRLFDELDAWKRPAPLELYITEAGYTTAPTPYRDVYVSEAEQARYLTDIFALPQLRATRIKVVVWFNLQDNTGWPAGLLRAEDLSRKPSYAAFRAVVRAQDGNGLP